MNSKKYLLLTGIVVGCALPSFVQAQDDEAVHVPLHDASRPPRIQAHLLNGSITVRGADVKDVTVEAHGASVRERHREPRSDPKAEGMKRLDIGGAGLDVTEDNNVVTVRTSMMSQPSALVITVPRRSSLQLKTLTSGGINVEGVEGEIDVDDLNGSVTLKNVSGSVLAHSLNGAVTATLDRIDSSKPMSFSTLNGDIDVTLPDSVKATVRMKTDNGEIYSDFDVKLTGGNSMSSDSGRQEDGRYRVRFDRSLRGTINGGGPEYKFTSFNGRIYIRRRK